MNKNMFVLGIMAAALAFVSCAKEKEDEVPARKDEVQIPFEIIASPAEVKTSNDGMSTRWAEGDVVNVFHAVAGSTDYINDGAFTVSDVENGNFVGSLSSALDPSKSYDWYLFYPYSEDVTSPENAIAGYCDVSACTKTPEEGDGESFLGGLPLAGKATTESGALTPRVSMLQLSAVIKVVVTNNSGSDLTITEVKFTSPVNIAGSYFVNFADPENPVYTDKPESVCQEVTLTTSFQIVAAGNSTFYLVVKPFEAPASSTLTLSVNGYEKSVVLDSAKSFSAGTMYLFTFDYDKLPPAPKRLVCWGSSVVNGQFTFTDYLQELLGDSWIVYNGGCSGDKSYEVAARQGSNPIVTGSEFTLPGRVTNTRQEGLLRARSISGEPGLYPLRAFRGFLRNPCKLVGTNGEEVLCDILSYYETTDNGNGGKDTTYYATVKRLEPGDPVVIAEHTPIETYAARELRDVDLTLICCGGNDGHLDFNNIIYQHQQMINYTEHPDDYIVLGYYMYPSWERYGYTGIMEAAFGNRFLNHRIDVTESAESLKYWLLWSGAYQDEASIPESEYTRASNGYWPLAFQISSGDPHPNVYGCKVTAQLIYNKMAELGYLD